MSIAMRLAVRFLPRAWRPGSAVRPPGAGSAAAAAVLLLAASSLACAIVACAPRSASATATAKAGAAPAVSGAGEKRRVPRPPPEEPKSKPARPGESTGSSDGSDDESEDFATSCLSSCVGSCLDNLFDSMLAAIFSPKKRAVAPADSLAWPALPPADTSAFAKATALEDATAPVQAPYEPHAWARFDVGFLRTHVPGDSVVLRRGPAGPDSLRLEAGRLPDGMRVIVTATRESGGGAMLEVRPAERPGPSGWVHEKSVRYEPPAEQAADSTAGADAGPAPFEPPPPPAPAIARPAEPVLRPAWAMAFSAGIGGIDNPELAGQYDRGAPVFEAEYLRCSRRGWVLGAGGGYRIFSGAPGVEYVGATEIDQPGWSKLQVALLGLEAGRRHAWRSGARFGYVAGPVLAYVHEDAPMQVLDAATRQPIRERHDSLGRWAPGGGAAAWVAAAIPDRYELGLRFRLFGLAWDGRREQSLTSDWTDEGLLQYEITLTLARVHP